jgi:hypothetical protein
MFGKFHAAWTLNTSFVYFEKKIRNIVATTKEYIFCFYRTLCTSSVGVKNIVDSFDPSQSVIIADRTFLRQQVLVAKI